MRSVTTLVVAVLLICLPAIARAAEAHAGAEAAGQAAGAVAGAAAGAHAEGAHHDLPRDPVRLSKGWFGVTNSIIETWLVALAIIGFVRFATRKIQDVPGGAQNFLEWLVETLHEFLEGIIGPVLVKKTFWFFATLFLFILTANWFGLIPGVGTIGWGHQTEGGFVVSQPLLRGVNADLNMTFGMALLFFLFWTIWALQVNGVKGFALHIFGPKGETQGLLKVLMIFVFIAAGFLEVVTILFRPVTLSFRLYGNIFAGENMLESMSQLVQNPPWAKAMASVIVPIPFYFLEVLVGLVQALVFMLLTAVFTMLICQHDEEHATEKAPH